MWSYREPPTPELALPLVRKVHAYPRSLLLVPPFAYALGFISLWATAMVLAVPAPLEIAVSVAPGAFGPRSVSRTVRHEPLLTVAPFTTAPLSAPERMPVW